MRYDVKYVREQFPATKREINGFPVAYFNGAAGTQVPQRVVDKMANYLLYHNANKYGYYATSIETKELVMEAKEIIGDFLGCSADEVSCGYSSTTNNFLLSQAIARNLKPGDEIVITDIDHTGNRSPWIALEERGIVIKSVKVDAEKLILDMKDFASKVTPKTKVAAINWASNGCGTISDVKRMIEMAHSVGALTVVDAVHYAAHRPIDVKEIDTDFLLCSAYKFFGPHLGVLYGKKEVMLKLPTLRVLPIPDDFPEKFETGTPNFEAICGTAEAINFIADIGEMYEENFVSELEGLKGRRRNIVAGMLAIDEYEEKLSKYLSNQLRKIPGIKIYTVPEGHPHTSTISISMEGKDSAELCKYLAEKGIFTASGNFWAVQLIDKVIGLKDKGGVVRLSFAPYNTMQDVERVVKAIKDFA